MPPYTPNGAQLRRVYWDDYKPIHFKVEDSRLSLYPTSPTYDPWTYDGQFMSKVIDDPNASLAYGRRVDYSDKVEAEAPDTADRNTQTQAEQNDAAAAAGRAAAVSDANTAANNSIDAAADTLTDIANGDLLGAAANAAKAAYHAHKAKEAYEDSGKDPAALSALQKANQASNDAGEALKAALEALKKS